MKLKVVSTLLFLAGSACAQLIPVREESGFLSSYHDSAPLTFTGNGVSMPFHADTPFRFSLSFRENVSATPASAEKPTGVGVHQFAAYSAAGAEGKAFSNAIGSAPISEAAPRAQADTFPLSQDQGVFALIAASTIP